MDETKKKIIIGFEAFQKAADIIQEESNGILTNIRTSFYKYDYRYVRFLMEADYKSDGYKFSVDLWQDEVDDPENINQWAACLRSFWHNGI